MSPNKNVKEQERTKKIEDAAIKVYDNIRKMRQMQGLSQEWVAKELDISQKHYSQIENGKVDIGIKMLLAIAEVLNVTPTILLGFSDERIFNNFNHVREHSILNQYNATDISIIQALYQRMLDDKEKLLQEQKALVKELIGKLGRSK